jgi:hypothetical protein
MIGVGGVDRRPDQPDIGVRLDDVMLDPKGVKHRT